MSFNKSADYLLSSPITTSMDCSIPRKGNTFWNCSGTVLRKEYLFLWLLRLSGAAAWICRSGVTWPDSFMSSLQNTVKISPGLLLFCNCIDWLPVGIPINWTVSGYFVLKCWNVLCLLLCQSAYCMSPLKNGCKAFSFSTLCTKFISSCLARESVTSTLSLINTVLLCSAESVVKNKHWNFRQRPQLAINHDTTKIWQGKDYCPAYRVPSRCLQIAIPYHHAFEWLCSILTNYS